MRRSARIALALVIGPWSAVACGSRTGLLVDEGPQVGASSSSAASTSSASSSSSHSVPAGCADAGSTSIFVVTESYSLYSFDPSTDAFRRVATLNCPLQSPGKTPFSMAVSRAGTAYVVFDDGELMGVDVATGACHALPFQQNQRGFSSTFGMAFASNAPAAGETLYVSATTATPAMSVGELGSIDINTLALRTIGPAPASAELTGTASGALYAFFAPSGSPSTTTIAPLDKNSGGTLGPGWVLQVPTNGGWAFASWGGAFYTFTGDLPRTPQNPGTTVVTRFDPVAGTAASVATLGELVVGAGVSTCAPER
jgi:hypothetical protein